MSRAEGWECWALGVGPYAVTLSHRSDVHSPPAAGQTLARPTYYPSTSCVACFQVLFDVERIRVSTSAPAPYTKLPALSLPRKTFVCVAPCGTRRLMPHSHAVNLRQSTRILYSHVKPLASPVVFMLSSVFHTHTVSPVLSSPLTR